MARFLGPSSVLKSPRTTRSYHVQSADRWADTDGLRPPAYIIGVGGFGVTYRVVDDRGQAFAMKEYFPRDHAKRGNDGRITPNASEGGFSRKIYEEGLRRFVAESHMLISFNHDSVCRVVDTFDDNGTSYQVMRLIEGRETLEAGDGAAAKIQRRVTLDDYLKEIDATDGVEVDLALIEPVLKQLLDALHYIHTEGTSKAQAITGEVTRAVLHRDIKPGNVLIEAPPATEDSSAAEILRMPGTKALLIDFGSARIFREAEEDDVSRSIGVVTEGYAPPELKDNHPDEQGPHSDIYSLAAVIWRAFLGKKPTSTALANGAKLASLAKPITDADGKARPRAPKAFLDAVDKALSAGTSARPQSVAAWRAELFAADKPGQQRRAARDDKRRPADDGKARPKSRTSPWIWVGAAGAVVGGIVALAVSGAGDVEQHIVKQGQAAYEDALRLSTQATVIAERAEIDAREGASEVDAALTSTQEASDKYARYEAAQEPLRIHHGYTSEGSGETFGTYHWCHRKSDTIIPDEAYRCDRLGCMRNGAETEWACTPHTHMISQTFDEVHNPWRVAGTGYSYDGQVDSFEAILGSGTLKIGDGVVIGRFRPRSGGGGLEVSGSATQKVSQKGLFRLELGKPHADLWSGEELDGQRVAFRGRAAGGGRLGLFIGSDGERFFGGEQASGLRVGRANLPDGASLYVSGAAAAADAQGRAWGEIQNGARRYFGQIARGKPDGCGVWEDGNNREAGFFVDGARTSGAPSSCKQERYASPDLAAFDDSGAASATPAASDSYPEKK